MAHDWFTRTFDALSVPEFRILWFGTMFAFLGFMMSFTAQSVVAFDLAGSNEAVGIVAAGSGASMVLVGPFGGVLADRLAECWPIVCRSGGCCSLVRRWWG